MLRRVALVRTEVSEEHSASIIRITRIGELDAMTVGIYWRYTYGARNVATPPRAYSLPSPKRRPHFSNAFAPTKEDARSKVWTATKARNCGAVEQWLK
jgi:hypothetical protein